MSDYPVLLHAAIDATDVPILAAFDRVLVGLHVRPGQEEEALYVLADPERHPFCLLVGRAGGTGNPADTHRVDGVPRLERWQTSSPSRPRTAPPSS